MRRDLPFPAALHKAFLVIALVRPERLDIHTFMQLLMGIGLLQGHHRFALGNGVGTIFEDSALPLDKWLAAIWMIVNAKNGVSSYEVHRAIGVTQKTAWFMLQRIRLAMQSGTVEKLNGEVEADETYIGGKVRNMHASKQRKRGRGTGGVGKAIVMGLLARHGKKGASRVKVKHVANARRGTVQGEVREHVEPGSQVFTDALPSYNGLNRDYVHEAINHAECYVRGNVHTNGLENFWSLLKRGIRGTYVSIEPLACP